jgi:hypothetical protein
LAKLTEKVGCDFSIPQQVRNKPAENAKEMDSAHFKGCMAAICLPRFRVPCLLFPQNYFPVQQNNRWVFNGPLKTLLITEQEEAATCVAFPHSQRRFARHPDQLAALPPG